MHHGDLRVRACMAESFEVLRDTQVSSCGWPDAARPNEAVSGGNAGSHGIKNAQAQAQAQAPTEALSFGSEVSALMVAGVHRQEPLHSSRALPVRLGGRMVRGQEPSCQGKSRWNGLGM